MLQVIAVLKLNDITKNNHKPKLDISLIISETFYFNIETFVIEQNKQI